MSPVIPGGAGEPYEPEPDVPAEPAQGKSARFLRGLGIFALVAGLLGLGSWLAWALLVPSPAATVEVPSLAGLTVAKAQQRLQDAGLTLGREDFETSDRPKDTIIDQDPRSGDRIEEGSPVNVVVSAGKEQVQVPDLIDFRSVEDARAALNDVGLVLGRVTEQDSDQPEETVLRQEPEPYANVDAGSAVAIWISNARVEVPDVIGRTEAQARTALFNLGFEVEYAAEVETDQFAPGTVAAQTPDGGTLAKKGSLVTLTLAKAPPPPTPTPTPTPTETPPSVDGSGGGADGVGGGGTAGGTDQAGANPGLSAPPTP